MGAVIVMGDFNAHVGRFDGSKSYDSINTQGILLNELIDRCSLNIVSLSDVATGPSYTYFSGSVRTTVDYVLLNLSASSKLLACTILDEVDLNTSDHLPLSVLLSGSVTKKGRVSDAKMPRIDWYEARKGTYLSSYAKEVRERLTPYLDKVVDSVEQVDNEVKHVSWLLVDAAVKTLPHSQKRNSQRYQDSTLSSLCVRSRMARRSWREAGCPREGPLYDEKRNLRRAVRRRVKICAAKRVRYRIRKREKLFASGDHSRFRQSCRTQSKCERLVIDGKLVDDPDVLMAAWAEHFRSLARSRIDELESLQDMERNLNDLASKSFGNEECILDVAFTVDEVANSVKMGRQLVLIVC